MKSSEALALLRLFNGVKVEVNKTFVPQSETLILDSIKNGFIIDPRISVDRALYDDILSVVGISGEKINSSFHKSWGKVKDTPMEVLVLEQILHYITTCGFEALGIYREEFVYIPFEKLEFPDANIKELKLTVVKALTIEDIFSRIKNIAGSGIALSTQTVEDIMTVVRNNQFKPSFAHDVKNRELKAKLYDYYGLLPQEPVEFLRYVVNKLTGLSLLIKDKGMIYAIKQSDGRKLDGLMKDAPKNLASIFHRYKPIFLAMKSISGNKGFYNRLRKQADTMHKPMKPDYLNTVTEQIKNGELNFYEMLQELRKVNTFRKIRLAYALQYRLNAGDSIVYQIRNGRNWVDDFEWSKKHHGTVVGALHYVLGSIAEDIESKVADRKILVPKGMHYALPATEKQFSGNIPNGSYIAVPNDDLIVGVYWENVRGHRVDLDLSMIDEDGYKVGWDSRYRSNERNILFSGDVTDASRGASELFYYQNGVGNTANMLQLNYYTFNQNYPVDFKLVIGSEKPNRFGNNYMLDPNNIVSVVPMKLDERQRSLGIIMMVDGEVRYYFSGGSFSNNISARADSKTLKAIDFYNRKLLNSIDLIDVLKMAGAEIVHEVPEGEDYIDLMVLDKSSLIELLS